MNKHFIDDYFVQEIEFSSYPNMNEYFPLYSFISK